MRTETTTERQVTRNAERGLFVIPCGSGFTCLGFEVCAERATRLASELGEPYTEVLGSMESYNRYEVLTAIAAERNAATGWRSTSELTPQLVGLEGKRVEVVDKYGTRRRFQVGKSTGFIPCHLEIARRNSSGGGCVYGTPFASVTVVRA